MALWCSLVTEPRHLVVLSLVGPRLEVDLLAGLAGQTHHHIAQGEVRGRQGAGGGGEGGGGTSWSETPGSDGLVSPACDQDLNISW